MKFHINGYLVKIKFVGDYISPYYTFKVYDPKATWYIFNRLVWKEMIHRKSIKNYKDTAIGVIHNYEKEAEKERIRRK